MRTKSIYIFTEGDSNELATWSNVPYFLSTTLEKKGYNVIRVDFSVWNLLKKIWNHTVSPLLDIFYPTHAYQFERTWLYNWFAERKIGNVVKKARNIDLIIIMNFSFYNKWNNVPTITFSDWSYDYYIRIRCQRKPYFFEKNYIERRSEAFKRNFLIVSLFKQCADYIKNRIPTANVKFLGNNVVNMIQRPPSNYKSVINQKRESYSLLFIGMKKYLSGAQLLVDTFDEIKKVFPNAELHIVGLTKADLKNLTDDIYCYGYLHKDNSKEADVYYGLMQKASVFVNPTEKWAGYSSTIEAMYYYTPVVVSPYEEFVGEFGKQINFGVYNKVFSKESLATSILSIFNADNYDELCLNAHNRVKDYTWDNYVERLLADVRL